MLWYQVSGQEASLLKPGQVASVSLLGTRSDVLCHPACQGLGSADGGEGDGASLGSSASQALCSELFNFNLSQTHALVKYNKNE